MAFTAAIASEYRTNIWPVLDVLDGRISPVVGFEVSFPIFDFCAEDSNVHRRRDDDDRGLRQIPK